MLVSYSKSLVRESYCSGASLFSRKKEGGWVEDGSLPNFVYAFSVLVFYIKTSFFLRKRLFFQGLLNKSKPYYFLTHAGCVLK